MKISGTFFFENFKNFPSKIKTPSLYKGGVPTMDDAACEMIIILIRICKQSLRFMDFICGKAIFKIKIPSCIFCASTTETQDENGKGKNGSNYFPWK